MKNFEVTTAQMINEKRELEKIFDGQSKFLAGAMALVVLNYVFLISIL